MISFHIDTGDTQLDQLLKEAGHYAASELMSSRRKLDIEVQLEDLSEYEYGYCDNLADRYFDISINQNLPQEEIIQTLLHEMVHVKQYASGELNNRGVVWKWNGELVDCEYQDSPWEIEAYELEQTLYEGYKLITN